MSHNSFLENTCVLGGLFLSVGGGCISGVTLCLVIHIGCESSDAVSKYEKNTAVLKACLPKFLDHFRLLKYTFLQFMFVILPLHTCYFELKNIAAFNNIHKRILII